MARAKRIVSRRGRIAVGTDREDGRKQITLVMTKGQFRKVNVHAKKEDISFAEAVRNAIDRTYG